MVSFVLWSFVVAVVVAIFWAIRRDDQQRTTTSGNLNKVVEVTTWEPGSDGTFHKTGTVLKKGGVTVREIRPTSGGDFVEETLVDDGANYYHVKRGSRRTFVRQWRALPGSWKQAAHETMMMGGQHYPDAARRFLAARAPWLDLEREPTNQYDPNAIKVMSTWQNPDGSIHRELLGYVAKDIAAMIADSTSPDHPIAATITAMGPSDEYVISVCFTIHVATSWCPLCKGDLGRAPRKPGTCKSCGGSFELSPYLGVAIPA